MATNQSTMYTRIATTIASSKGIALNSTNGNNVSIVNPTSISLNENPHPSTNSMAAKIKLMTYVGGNVASPETIVEQYFIRPNFTGMLKCAGAENNIFYLPLNSIYAIKFYAPDQYNSEFYNYVYAVPAKVDSTYWTGFKDYTTGVPQAWVTAFVQYASALPANVIPNTSTSTPTTNATKTFSATEATQKKQFSFNFWGTLSGTIGKSSTFVFEYSFYPGASPLEPNVNITR